MKAVRHITYRSRHDQAVTRHHWRQADLDRKLGPVLSAASTFEASTYPTRIIDATAAVRGISGRESRGDEQLDRLVDHFGAVVAKEAFHLCVYEHYLSTGANPDNCSRDTL